MLFFFERFTYYLREKERVRGGGGAGEGEGERI